MTRRAVPAIVLVPLFVVALVVSSSACGTFSNFASSRPPRPFGGVVADLEAVVESNPIKSPHLFLYTPIVLVEICLSTVFDAATLPLVAWIQVHYILEMPRPDGPPPVSGPLLRPAE
ncbi:MAG TPA: hypothetical protein VKD90_11045 [Gemmataceae bacterium]|nr:hypothetical protein [Gemmataceae bacterium]